MSPSENRERAYQAIVEAVRRAGGEGKLADEINRLRPADAEWKPQTRSHVNAWKLRKRCPEQLVPIIEKITGVRREDLRPDAYYEVDPPAPEERAEPQPEAAE